MTGDASIYRKYLYFCSWGSIFILLDSNAGKQINLRQWSDRLINPVPVSNVLTCVILCANDHRRIIDLAGILEGRMASEEGGSVPSRVGYAWMEGCLLRRRLGGWGSVVISTSGVRGTGPAENGFWRILKATERSFLYLYNKIWGENLH